MGANATNGNETAGSHGDEAEDGDVFEDAPERIPSPVNERGDGPGRKETAEKKEEELCNGYVEENGDGDGDGDGDMDLPLKPKLPPDVKENGLDSASSTPTKESLNNGKHNAIVGSLTNALATISDDKFLTLLEFIFPLDQILHLILSITLNLT